MSPTGSELIGIVVGLAAEARLAAGLGCVVEIGGGTPAGAEAAVARLIARGVTGVVSFGLAGGLDPTLRPGMLVVPEAVVVADAVPEGGVPKNGVPEGGVPEGTVPEGLAPADAARPPSPVSWPGLARPPTTSYPLAGEASPVHTENPPHSSGAGRAPARTEPQGHVAPHTTPSDRSAAMARSS